jgi:hypothetical protein
MDVTTGTIPGLLRQRARGAQAAMVKHDGLKQSQSSCRARASSAKEQRRAVADFHGDQVVELVLSIGMRFLRFIEERFWAQQWDSEATSHKIVRSVSRYSIQECVLSSDRTRAPV